MKIDISHIAEENHHYAIHLATVQKIIAYKNNTFIIADIAIKRNSFEAVDFWRNISLSAEILLKACLLKHHILFFKKRANSKYGEKVTAIKNKWLEDTLKNLNIQYVAQINTGTVNTALKHLEKELFVKIPINAEKKKLISQMFYFIIRTRRNRNSHFYFPNQGDININEVEMMYLPLLNHLESLYKL